MVLQHTDDHSDSFVGPISLLTFGEKYVIIILRVRYNSSDLLISEVLAPFLKLPITNSHCRIHYKLVN